MSATLDDVVAELLEVKTAIVAEQAAIVAAVEVIQAQLQVAGDLGLQIRALQDSLDSTNSFIQTLAVGVDPP